MTELPSYGTNLREAGAHGDGTGDVAEVVERLMRRGEELIIIPQGDYQATRPIRLRSGTRIMAHPCARIRIADGVDWGVRDALLTNADWEGGDRNIEISGGVWDGNNANVRRAGEDERDGYTGNLMLFRNVEGLILKDMKLTDPVSYFVCLGRVRKFLVEGIRFEILNHTWNQDGIHVSGYCEDGVIRDIRGYGKYCPGDDLVALNACDALDRSETRSALAGPIRRMRVSRLYAEDCHAFMRFASVWSTIEDVDVNDVEGGCVDAAFNADALRFCRSPLFELEDPAFANGCGDLRNIRISKVRVWKTRDMGSGLLQLHSRMNNFVVEDFARDFARDANPLRPSLDIAYLPGASGRLEGLTSEDQSRLEPACGAAGLAWEKDAAGLPGNDLYTSAFTLSDNARLKASLHRFRRLSVDSTPLHPLPEPDWNKGMSR